MSVPSPFKRSSYRVPHGTAKNPLVTFKGPAWGLFSAEAEYLVADLCAKRGLATGRPAAFTVVPNTAGGQLWLYPGPEDGDNFSYQVSDDGKRTWINLVELFAALELTLQPDEAREYPVTVESMQTYGWCLVIHLRPERLAARTV